MQIRKLAIFGSLITFIALLGLGVAAFRHGKAVIAGRDPIMAQPIDRSITSSQESVPALDITGIAAEETLLTQNEPVVTAEDGSLHWENLYETDWMTDAEMAAEIDRQWALAAEWGYTRPSEAAALIDYLLSSGIISGTGVPRQHSEIEAILPPRHAGETAVLVGSAGLTSLQEDDAGNWRYFPLASDLGQISDGAVIGDRLLFSGSAGGWHEWIDEEETGQLWEGGAVFDNVYQASTEQTYLATNRGVWVYGPDGIERLISEPDLFGWSIAQDATGHFWVGGEQTIQDALSAEFDEEGNWVVAGDEPFAGHHLQSIKQGMVWRYTADEWVSVGVFPDDPIIREIAIGMVDGKELVVARGHRRVYLFDPLTNGWEILLDQSVSSLLIAQNTLYIGTENSQLLVYQEGVFRSIALDTEADAIFLLDLYLTSTGRMLVGTPSGVYVVDLLSGVAEHTHRKNGNDNRAQMGKLAGQMPTINRWCPVFGAPKNNYVWYAVGEHNIGENPTAIEFQMGTYSSNDISLYPWHSHVGKARKVMWYCDGDQMRARSWKGCSDLDGCNDNLILSNHLNSNGDAVGGGVSCNHDYYAAVWSEIPGYQFQIGRTVGKTDLQGTTTSNNNRYNAAVELVPSDFGDLRAEQESDFPTTDVFFRQHVAHEKTNDQVRSGAWNGEQTPNYEDGGDDGLTVYVNGVWQHPEHVMLSMGKTYKFRVRTQSHGGWYWDPETFIRIYGDWDGVSDKFAVIDRYEDGQLIGDYEFEITIPTNSIVNPWLRVTLSHEEPRRIFDFWDEDKKTQIMGEIEDYRLTVSAATDLAVTKNDTADPVMYGDIIDYDITVRNNGPMAANDVRLVDELPAGTDFVSASGGGFTCTNTANQVICTRDSIGVNDAHTIRLRLRTADETISQVTNAATVSMSNEDLVPENNRDTETTTIELLADVAIEKHDSADPVYTGNPFQYILTVSNNGPHTARDVTVTDTVPDGITLQSAAGGGFACHVSGRRLSCTRPILAAGARTQITVAVTAGNQAGSVTNTAEVTTSTPEQTLWNNAASESTAILTITDLEISKTDVQDPVVVGDTIQWRLVATNAGPQAAENVVIEDTLPADVAYRSHRTFVSGGGTNWGCQVMGRTVRCETATMPVGQVVTIEIFAGVPSGTAVNQIENTATIETTTAEITLTNNTSRETTEIRQLIDLVVEKTDNIDPVIAGDVLIWSLAVSNNGPSIARQVTLQDTLPPQLTAADVAFLPNTSWSCTAETLTCVLNEDLPPNAFAPLLQLSVMITDSYGDELVNSVAVTAAEPEADPSNNIDTEITTIGRYIRRVPPNGYLFLHARYSDELGWEDETAVREEDYLASDLILNPLQVPLEVGLAFHAEEAAYLCLSQIEPCPVGDTILGETEVVSYTITGFTAISPTASIDVVYIGEQAVSIGRQAEANFVYCTGDCVAYGLHQNENYRWAETAYYTLVQTSQGGRQIVCDQCASMTDASPGYYQLAGTVSITVSYPGYAELNQSYELPGVFTFQIVAPFINDR